MFFLLTDIQLSLWQQSPILHVFHLVNLKTAYLFIVVATSISALALPGLGQLPLVLPWCWAVEGEELASVFHEGVFCDITLEVMRHCTNGRTFFKLSVQVGGDSPPSFPPSCPMPGCKLTRTQPMKRPLLRGTTDIGRWERYL